MLVLRADKLHSSKGLACSQGRQYRIIGPSRGLRIAVNLVIEVG